MFVKILLSRIFHDPVETFKFVLEVFIIYIITRFRHKIKRPEIDFSGNLVSKLILEYEPEELIKNQPPEFILEKTFSKDFLNLASYDAFLIGSNFKEESKRVVSEYGIGTCGPPTFFGTLDLHLALQEKISEILGTEDSLLYSNSYTCIHSIISCFSTNSDTIFYHRHSSEAIIRGIQLSKSRCYEYDSIETLHHILKLYFSPKRRNFVLIEGLSKNEGTIFDLNEILKLKEEFDFKVILDESLSIPFLDKQGLCGYYNVDPKLIDIRIGSFSYGFSSSGGFFTGRKELANYQRLSSSSYVFSASLPGFIANFNKLALELEFDYSRLRKKIKAFHKHFISAKFTIISHLHSPIILIRTKMDPHNKACKLTRLYRIVNELHKRKIYVGINNNPTPTMRIVININQTNLKELAYTISNVCENLI